MTYTDELPLLDDYSTSSAAYRVRIGLALKGIEYRRILISRLDGAEEASYFEVNPQGFVPTLEVSGLRREQFTASSNISTNCGPSRHCCRAIRWARARACTGCHRGERHPAT